MIILELDAIQNNQKEIEIWKKKLLDLGKRNNLINYKDNKSSTLEILSPAFYDAFERIVNYTQIQIYDDKIDDKDDNLFENENNGNLSKEEFIRKFKNKVPEKQVLLFNPYQKTKRILKSLMKKASDSITERGVNILYIAFGFIKFRENDVDYKAPILMIPITLHNSALNEPFYIRHFDEDISTNTTLQYLLETQYGISIPTYIDEDLDEYLNKIEELISPVGFEILEEIRISTFSFNKLNMYLDLENNSDKIMNNPNVGALTLLEKNDSDIFITGDEIEAMNNARDLFINQHNVVDADFSQTEAIEYAINGKSFVLQGPPGTGKSQTITNMIAELIYNGKKVLFVSEKMAALEVVYNNLKKAKLSDFCLELHSYKANKKDFIDDLYSTLNKPKTKVGSELNNNQGMLNEYMGKLNDYDSALYEVHEPIHMSLYQLIGNANHYSKTVEVPYIIKNISELGLQELYRYIDILNRYKNYEPSIGYNYKNHPLFGLRLNDSSFAFKLRFKEMLEKYIKSSRIILDKLNDIRVLYNINLSNNDEAIFFINFVSFLSENKLMDNSYFNIEFIDDVLSRVNELDELETDINNATSIIDEKYNKDIYNENIKEHYENVNSGTSFFKKIFNSKYKKSFNKLKSLYKLNKLTHNQAIDDLRVLKDRCEKLDKYNELSKIFITNKISQYNGLNTDYKFIKRLFTDLKDYLTKKRFESKDSLNNITLDKHDPVLIKELQSLINDDLSYEKNLGEYVDLDIINLGTLSTEEKEKKIEVFLMNLEKMDGWVDFYHLYSELKENNLFGFLDKVIELDLPLKFIADYYKLCFYRQWVDYILSKNINLSNYNRFNHEGDIEKFKVKDRTQLDISKAKINEKLSEMRPDPMLQMNGSPASVIKREHEKKKKQKPIRMIMKEIPEFIQELKPCFLMSPLSVSTFLPDDMEFDVTIFDEASQVFPEDAIVAIYRSKQLIVVGDSKQMPPTKFFMTGDNDDDEYDENESDLDSFESILDLCTTTLPTKSLLCHYRSKDEGLINFSNKNFYNYDLITYPSIYEKKKDLGVDFIYLENGIMNTTTKVNIVEAEKVVDLVFEHFKNYPNRSLGVVAFNIRQQDIILKLLDKRRAQDPSYEEFFRPDLDEPFFVKNLETVQGDERDTIIFSITYAKNDKGSFALRFGPLNLEGGERRLNVAITRAKLNVKVVSSIKALDIDVNKVTNLGPKLLHDYLDYAEHGSVSLERAVSLNDNEEFQTPFEKDVYYFLKENGFDVSTQVGSSKYKIDLGLKKPNSNDYVLAIECDGATYHTQRSARDRDRLRESVLENMNWKYYRIWSVDWYKNNLVEKQALIDACKEALLDSTDGFIESNNDDTKIDISNMITTEEVIGSGHIYDKYTKYEGQILPDSKYMAEKYAEVEGPISVDYFLKQVCSIWGYEKATAKVKELFNKEFTGSDKCYIEDGFIYTPNQKNYAMRRDLGSILKDINYISDYEIMNGMYSAIKLNKSCNKEDLYDFIRDQLGFNRAGDKITKKFDKAFRMLRPHIFIDEDGNITLNEVLPLKIMKREE